MAHKIKTNIVSLILLFSLNAALYGKIFSEARFIGLPEKFYDNYIVPSKGKKLRKDIFRESFHEGSYREIGRSQGRYLLAKNPEYKNDRMKLFKSLFPEGDSLWKRDPEVIRGHLKQVFPEIVDEIEGFAEVVGISKDDALRIYSTYGVALFGCTVFTAGREKGKGGDIVIGRNFDWHMALSDLTVTGIRPKGALASIGCAEAVVGRVDGINEAGLFIGVTVSVARKGTREGYFCPIVIRAVLDKAENIDEALEILQKVPQTAGWTFMLAEKSGRACVAEYAPGSPVAERWMKDTGKGFIVTTNHYQSSELAGKNGVNIPNSYERLHIATERIEGLEKVGIDDAMKILRSQPPEGVYFTNFEVMGGTVYSGAYNLTKGIWKLKTGDHTAEYKFDQFMKGKISTAVQWLCSPIFSGNIR